MKINSDDKLAFVSFILRSRDSRDEKILGWSVISLEIEVSCGGFAGRDDDVTFRDDEVASFLGDLQRLEKERRGAVTLASLDAPSSYPQFKMELYTIDASGHMIVKVDMVKVRYVHQELSPSRVSVAFETDPEYLSTIVRDFNELFENRT